MSVPETPAKLVAVTGGTGFIGRHLIDRLLADGWRVRALTRQAQTERAGITWIKGDLSDLAALDRLVADAGAVIHLAGLIKARTRAEFFAGNAGGTANLIAATAATATTARFILVTSLTAREPLLSDYAASKLRAEQMLAQSPLPHWAIVRPPAVYGPGDRETLAMFKAAKFGVMPRFGGHGHRFSMIHVADLAGLLAMMAASAPHRMLVEPDDGQPGGYSLDEVATHLMPLNPRLMMLPVPGPLLELAAMVAHGVARAVGKPTMLSPGKARELIHPDWVCRAREGLDALPWRAEIPFSTGAQQTLDWYRAQNWI